MQNNWEYEINDGILTLRFDLLGEPLALTGSKRGDRVRMASTNNLVVVAEGIPASAHMILTCNLSRLGTPQELRRFYLARQSAEAILRGDSV